MTGCDQELIRNVLDMSNDGSHGSSRQHGTPRQCIECVPLMPNCELSSIYNTTECYQSTMLPSRENGQSNVNVLTLSDKLNSITMNEHVYGGTDMISTMASNTDSASEYCKVAQDGDGDTILHNSIILHNSEYAIECINCTTSPSHLSMKNTLSQSPLHLAVLTNQTLVARRLVVGGADIEARDRNGNTALHIACREGYLEMATVLLKPVGYIETKQNRYEFTFQKIPQNLELTNFEGHNCLHVAAMNGHSDLVKLLIERGANINSKDLKTGRTILHNACLVGDINLVKLLLQYQECELNAQTYDGNYPFDLARVRGNYDILKELAIAGAQNGDSEDEKDL